MNRMSHIAIKLGADTYAPDLSMNRYLKTFILSEMVGLLLLLCWTYCFPAAPDFDPQAKHVGVFIAQLTTPLKKLCRDRTLKATAIECALAKSPDFFA